jgi:hypothetical protein
MRIVVAITVLVFAGRGSAGEIIHVGKNMVEAAAKFFREKPVKPIEREQLRFIFRSEKPNAGKQAIEELKWSQAEETMWEAADQETREMIQRIQSVLDRDNEEDAAEMAKAEDKEWKRECTQEFVKALKKITCSSIKTYIKTDKPPTDEELDREASKEFRDAWQTCGKYMINRKMAAESSAPAPLLKGIKTLKALRILDALFNDLGAQHDAIKRFELLIAYLYCR